MNINKILGGLALTALIGAGLSSCSNDMESYKVTTATKTIINKAPKIKAYSGDHFWGKYNNIAGLTRADGSLITITNISTSSIIQSEENAYIDEYLPEGEEATAFAMNVWGYEPAEQGLALNKTGTEYISTINGEYELIELFGKPALFTNERLTDADIPEGLYCYHLRESDDGDRFGSIEPEVAVNHGGSVITDEPLDFGEAGYIEFTDDTSPNFLGNDITFEEYMRGDFEPDQTQGEQQL